MDWLYEQFVAGKQKALVGFIVTAVVAFLVKNGVQLPANSAEVLQSMVWGLVGLVSVYMKRNK